MDAQHDSPAQGAAEGEGATRYAAFLLRVWHNEGEGNDGWRMVIETVGSEERHGFTEWDALVQHICDSLMVEREP